MTNENEPLEALDNIYLILPHTRHRRLIGIIGQALTEAQENKAAVRVLIDALTYIASVEIDAHRCTATNNTITLNNIKSTAFRAINTETIKRIGENDDL